MPSTGGALSLVGMPLKEVTVACLILDKLWLVKASASVDFVLKVVIFFDRCNVIFST